MESVIQAYMRGTNEQTYATLVKIVGYVDANYAVDTLFDGADELKFRCGGRTLLTLYLREESVTALLNFGRREREEYEMVQDTFSEFIQDYYRKSRTYHDGKWMFIELQDDVHLGDILRLIEIKRKPNKRTIAMCGYRCDLCQAYSRNIQKDDQRASLSLAWQKYYEIESDPAVMYCDGCRSAKKDAQRIDSNCPVRGCVLNRNINSCVDCGEYPCGTFAKREGLCFEQAREKRGVDFSGEEFDRFLRAFDNKTRIDRLRMALSSSRG